MTGLLAKFHPSCLPSLVEAAAHRWCAAPLEMNEGTPLGVKITISIRLQCCFKRPQRGTLPYLYPNDNTHDCAVIWCKMYQYIFIYVYLFIYLKPSTPYKL
jgi:hypothetical protein